jgi:hypothetical protein
VKGSSYDLIEFRDNGGNFIRLDPNSDQPINIEDAAGNRIFTDKNKGQVCLVGAKGLLQEVKQMNTVVEGLSDTEVRGDEKKKVMGNKETDITGDINLGVMGTTSTTLSGALKAVVANASPSGPELTSLDILVMTGNVHLQNVLGDILFDTLAGDVELSTLAGSALLGNLLASFNADISGKIEASATTTAEISGVTQHIGSIISAIEPLVQGTQLVTKLTPLLVALAAAGTAATAGAAIPTPVTNAAAIAALGTALNVFAQGFIAILTPAPAGILSTKSFTS